MLHARGNIMTKHKLDQALEQKLKHIISKSLNDSHQFTFISDITIYEDEKIKCFNIITIDIHGWVKTYAVHEVDSIYQVLQIKSTEGGVTPRDFTVMDNVLSLWSKP